jgi:uncharacterized glyoxalase superfamily protein PhnB
VPRSFGHRRGAHCRWLNFAEAERIFQALSENGKVHTPIGQTFWAERFGMLVDQFGIPWMVNCEGKVKYE